MCSSNELSQFVSYEIKMNDVLYDFEMIKVPLAATLIFRKSTLHMTVTKKQYRISKELLLLGMVSGFSILW